MSKEVLILELILRATQQGALVWRAGGPDTFFAEAAPLRLEIAFQCPLPADETASGADLVTVTAGRLMMTFANGTEGMYHVREILAAAIPAWKEHSAGIDERADEAIAVLRKLTTAVPDEWPALDFRGGEAEALGYGPPGGWSDEVME